MALMDSDGRGHRKNTNTRFTSMYGGTLVSGRSYLGGRVVSDGMLLW